MSQPPNPPYPGQPHPDQPAQGTPWPGQPYPNQPHPGQPHPGQPYLGQQPGQQPGQPGGEQPWSSPPGQDQPYYGGPNPDVPASGPPQQPGYPAQSGYPQTGYPQTGYQQTGYQQSGYPAPAYPPPGYPQNGPPPGYPPASKPKSRAVPITLLSIALVLVLCVGGGTALYLVGRNNAEGTTDVAVSAPPTRQPTTRQPTTAPPTPTISIVEPRTLGGRPKVTDPQFANRVDLLEQRLALVPGASQAVGAIYGTPAKRDLVVVVAAKAFVADPKTDLDKVFTGSTVDELKLTNISSIPAGPLGGVAKCAKGDAGGAPLAMCAWADEGSTGWLFWYFTSLSKAEDQFVELRGQVEKKSN